MLTIPCKNKKSLIKKATFHLTLFAERNKQLIYELSGQALGKRSVRHRGAKNPIKNG
jgi:hypothetical protein